MLAVADQELHNITALVGKGGRHRQESRDKKKQFKKKKPVMELGRPRQPGRRPDCASATSGMGLLPTAAKTSSVATGQKMSRPGTAQRYCPQPSAVYARSALQLLVFGGHRASYSVFPHRSTGTPNSPSLQGPGGPDVGVTSLKAEYSLYFFSARQLSMDGA